MADFAVYMNLRAKDHLSGSFGVAGEAARRFKSTANTALNSVGRSASRTAQIIRGVITAQVIRRAFMGVIRIGEEAVDAFTSMDDAIRSAAIRFRDLPKDAVYSGQALTMLEKSARRTGDQTEFTSLQASRALESFATAGFSARDSMNVMGQSVDFSTANTMDLDESVKNLTRSMGAFGLESKNALVQLSQYNRLTDIVTKTATTAKIKADLLFESIFAGANSFTTAGQSAEMYLAVIRGLAQVGIVGERAGTAARNMILKLVPTSERARNSLRRLGVQVADDAGNYRDFIDILGDFQRALKSMGTAQRSAVTDMIFGKRAVDAVTGALKLGGTELRSYYREISHATGATKEIASFMREGLGVQLKILQSAAMELGFRVLEAFRGDARTAIKELTQYLRDFDAGRIVNWMTKIKDVALDLGRAVRPLLEIVPIAASVFRALADIIVPLAPAIKLLVKPVMGLMIGFRIFSMLKPAVLFLEWAGGIAMATNAFGGLTSALSVMVAAMASSPIAAFAGILTGIVATATLLRDSFPIFAEFADFLVKPFEPLIWVIKHSGELIRLLQGKPAVELVRPLTNAAERRRIRESAAYGSHEGLHSLRESIITQHVRSEAIISGKITLGNAPAGTTFTGDINSNEGIRSEMHFDVGENP